jgi:hypothetical protein
MHAIQSGSLLPCDLLGTLLASCALAPSLLPMCQGPGGCNVYLPMDDHHHVALLPSVPVRVKKTDQSHRTQVAGQRIMRASSCAGVGVVHSGAAQTVPCRCKSIYRWHVAPKSQQKSEQWPRRLHPRPAKHRNPHRPPLSSRTQHAHGHGLRVVVVAVASAASTDRTSTHRIHIGEERPEFGAPGGLASTATEDGRCSVTVGPDSGHSEFQIHLRPTGLRRMLCALVKAMPFESPPAGRPTMDRS